LRHQQQVARQRSLLESFDLDDLVAASEPLDRLGAEEVDYESAGLIEALTVVDAPAEIRVVRRARGVDAEATGPQDAQDLLREREQLSLRKRHAEQHVRVAGVEAAVCASGDRFRSRARRADLPLIAGNDIDQLVDPPERRTKVRSEPSLW
jgi:hypothetical protein